MAIVQVASSSSTHNEIYYNPESVITLQLRDTVGST
jgi:hypothetical protein